MCVQHVTRKKSAEVIEHRIIESMKLDKLVKIGNLNGEAFLSGRYEGDKLAKVKNLNGEASLIVRYEA